MADGISGIDHCIVLVHDLEAARAQMAHLGFAPAPRGVHSEHMGTHNHCVMLERGYFEVLAVRHPTERNERWRNVLATREGLAAVAYQTQDARAADAHFHSVGIESHSLVDFARPVELPEGDCEASFTTVTLPPEVAPVPMFLCQHHTPDVVWRPEYLPQPNGCIGLKGAELVVTDTVSAAQSLFPAFADSELGGDARQQTITTPGGVLRITSQDGLAERYAAVPRTDHALPYVVALHLAVSNIDATEAFLASAGVATHPGPDGTRCVAPADACGAILTFSEH